MKHWAKAFVLLLVFLLFAPLVTIQHINVRADWSTYRSNAYRNGVGTGNPVLNPTFLWKSNISSPVEIAGIKGNYENQYRAFTAPVVSEGIVYASSRSQVEITLFNNVNWFDVFAFNASNGKIIWDYKVDIPDRVFYDTIPCAIADDMLIFGIIDYGVGALNASTGTMLWNNTTVDVYGSSPVVENGVVFLGGGFVYALNQTNGNIIWKVSPPDRYGSANIVSSPAIADGVLYIGSGKSTYALNATTGDIIWSYKTSGVIFSDPSYDNGIIYVTSHDGNAYALNASFGTQIWNYSTTPPISTWKDGANSEPSSPSVSNGLMYFSGNYLPPEQPNTSVFYALNTANGKPVWNISRILDINGWFWHSNPSVVNRVVYEKGGNGADSLYALNTNDGTVIWNYNETTVDSDPIINNGVLYFGSNGQIYAIGTLPLSPLTPSPSNNLTQKNISEYIILEIAIIIVFITALVTLILFFRRHRKTASKPKA